MNIKYHRYSEIDLDRWDQCITESINGIIYAYSNYLDQVSPEWGALILNDYEAVMPLPRKEKWGFRYLIQPIFVQQLGIFSPKPVNSDLIKVFLQNLPSYFRYINYNFNIHNQFTGWSDATLQNRVTYELDLIPGYGIISQNYSSQTRRNLKKAQKEQVYVVQVSEAETVIQAFKNNKGKDLKAFNEREYNTLRHLITSGILKGHAKVYHAYGKQNNFCSGAVFFFSHHKAILIFTGSTPEARNNGALTAIIDHFIQQYSSIHLTLDFEGSSDKNLARFYSGFGSKECVFLQLEWINLPPTLKHLVKLYRWLRR